MKNFCLDLNNCVYSFLFVYIIFKFLGKEIYYSCTISSNQGIRIEFNQFFLFRNRIISFIHKHPKEPLNLIYEYNSGIINIGWVCTSMCICAWLTVNICFCLFIFYFCCVFVTFFFFCCIFMYPLCLFLVYVVPFLEKKNNIKL